MRFCALYPLRGHVAAAPLLGMTETDVFRSAASGIRYAAAAVLSSGSGSATEPESVPSPVSVPAIAEIESI